MEKIVLRVLSTQALLQNNQEEKKTEHVVEKDEQKIDIEEQKVVPVVKYETPKREYPKDDKKDLDLLPGLEDKVYFPKVENQEEKTEVQKSEKNNSQRDVISLETNQVNNEKKSENNQEGSDDKKKKRKRKRKKKNTNTNGIANNSLSGNIIKKIDEDEVVKFE